MTFFIFNQCGEFAENKDQARSIRESIKTNVDYQNDGVILDFGNVDSTTQSFVHALISSFFQEHGEDALNFFEFKNCNKPVKSLITTVINYSI